MNIGITCYPTFGGSGAIATELGQVLAKRGHKVHFISYSIPFRLQDYNQNISFHDVEVMPYPLFKWTISKRGLRLSIRNLKRRAVFRPVLSLIV